MQITIAKYFTDSHINIKGPTVSSWNDDTLGVQPRQCQLQILLPNAACHHHSCREFLNASDRL